MIFVPYRGAIAARTPNTRTPNSRWAHLKIDMRIRFGQRTRLTDLARPRCQPRGEPGALEGEPHSRPALAVAGQAHDPEVPPVAAHHQPRTDPQGSAGPAAEPILGRRRLQLRHSPIPPKLLVLVWLVVNLCLLHFCSVASTSVSTDATSAAQNGASASAPTSPSCVIDSRS
jgi:hypothetical protein